MKRLLLSLVIISSFTLTSYASSPIVIQEQGSFMVGGTTSANEGEFVFSDWMSQSGQTAYGDHAYVWYQVPVNAKKFPIVFLHGGGQSKKTWETTPDGRDLEGVKQDSAQYRVMLFRLHIMTAQCSRSSGLDDGRNFILIHSFRKTTRV